MAPTTRQNGENGLYAHVIDVPENFLYDNELNLCMVQTGHITEKLIQDDSSRKKNITTLRELLLGKPNSQPAIKQAFPLRQPVMVQFPELAFSSNDWSAIDEIVGQYDGKIILLAGFGYTKGDKLKKWLEEKATKTTKIIESWEETDRNFIIDENRYNAGWCWLKGTNSTWCILFIKHFPEQDHEDGGIANFGLGISVPIIKTTDINIFPIICSDFIHEDTPAVGATDVVLTRLTKFIMCDLNKMNLFSTISYQEKPHSRTWQRKISTVLQKAYSQNIPKLIIAITNRAMDVISKDNNKDMLRNLSGVYVHPNIINGHRLFGSNQNQGVRKVAAQSKAGFLVRNSSAVVVAGKTRDNPSATAGKHIWLVKHYNGILNDGRLTGRKEFNIGAYELSRRICIINGCTSTKDSKQTKCEKNMLCELRKIIVKWKKTKIVDFTTSIIHGYNNDNSTASYDYDEIYNDCDSFDKALTCIASLLKCSPVDWCNDSVKKPAQLTRRDFDILVWPALNMTLAQAMEATKKNLNNIKSDLLILSLTKDRAKPNGKPFSLGSKVSTPIYPREDGRHHSIASRTMQLAGRGVTAAPTVFVIFDCIDQVNNAGDDYERINDFLTQTFSTFEGCHAA